MPYERFPHPTRHKASNRAVVRLNGKDHYLGPWRSAEAKVAYERLIAEWLAHGRRLPQEAFGLNISELMLAYWNRCKQHYRKPDGSPSSELALVRHAMRPLRAT